MSQSDIFSRLLVDRTITLPCDVDNVSATYIQMQLLYLDTISNEPIQLLINSGGGGVYDGLGIIDVMNYVKSPVQTMCIGMAASMAAVILANGEKGYRMCLPNSRVMIHQASGWADGKTSDIEIRLKEQKSIEMVLFEILAKTTGKTVKQVEKDCQSDYYFSPQEALKYGLIDDIVISR